MTTYLQPGDLFAGRYRVLRCLAVGGMGAVYEVLHVDTDRRRALKVMLPHLFQSQELRERFQREAKVAAHIESEFIVEVFDAGVDEATGMPFLVMELLKGEELGHRVERLGRLPPEEALHDLWQTAMALDKTHQASIVHRDLKPENLFLTEREGEQPRVKVLDFGVAKVIAQTSMRRATQSVGTPMYMAPEQYNPSATLTGAADIYALGMVAYTLLVGEAYWTPESESGNVFAMATATLQGPSEAPSLRALRRGVTLPPGFDGWFARITASNPADRFPTACEAVHALEEVFAHEAARSVSLSPVLPTVTRPTLMTASGLVTTSQVVPRGGREMVMASVGAGAIALVIAAMALGLRRSPPMVVGTAAPPPQVTVAWSVAPSTPTVPPTPASTPTVTPTPAPEPVVSASASTRRPPGKLPAKKKKYTQD